MLIIIELIYIYLLYRNNLYVILKQDLFYNSSLFVLTAKYIFGENGNSKCSQMVLNFSILMFFITWLAFDCIGLHLSAKFVCASMRGCVCVCKCVRASMYTYICICRFVVCFEAMQTVSHICL